MISHKKSILVVVLLTGIIAGCSDAPTDQLEGSKTALEQARTAEAEIYASATFKEASDSLNAALVEIQKQDGKFSLMRDYDQAELIIKSVQQLAEKAQTEAVAEKERVRVQDSVLVAEINALITETRTAIANAPKGKGSRVDLKMMRADIDAAAAALETETLEYQKGNYMVSFERLTTIKSQVAKVKSDIEAAVTGMTKK